MPRTRRTRSRALVAGFEALEARRVPAALIVSTTLDSGPGSLRQAIADANAAAGSSTIDFAIPGAGVRTIAPLTPLPRITAPVTIDATTQPGYEGTPVVALDGSQAGDGDGLSFAAAEFGAASSVAGLAIGRFRGDGIAIDLAAVTIRRTYVGLDPTGAGGGGNLGAGIRVDRSPGGVIGGLLTDANVIAGNGGDGIVLTWTNSIQVTNNFIGTDAAGRADLGNAGNGVTINYGNANVAIRSNVIANNGLLAIDDRDTFANSPAAIGPNLTANNGTRRPDLVFTVAPPAVAGSPGDLRTLTYTVTNRGPGPATGVGFGLSSRYYTQGPRDDVADPAVFRYLNTTTTLGSINPDANVNGLTAFRLVGIDRLDPGASATITVSLRLVNPGDDTFDATLSAEQPSLSTSAASTPVAVAGAVDLATAALPAPAIVRAGSPVALTFLVTNRDATFGALPDLTLALPDPDSATVVAVSASRGTLAPVAGRPGVYAGRIAARRPDATTFLDVVGLDPGESVSVTVVLVPLRDGPILAALAVATAGNDDPRPADNLAIAGTLVSSFVAAAPRLTSAALDSARGGAIRAVVLTFDAALDPARAQDVRNYRLTAGGRPVALRWASYDGSTNRVTLRPARALAARGGPVRVRLDDGRSAGLRAADGATPVAAADVAAPRRAGRRADAP